AVCFRPSAGSVRYHTKKARGKAHRRSVVGAVAGAVIFAPPALSGPARPVFAPDSFWYQPIAKIVALNPNSDAYVAEFLRQYRTYYNNAGVNLGSYGALVYTGGRYAKTATVAQWNCGGYLDPDLPNQGAEVPIPSYAIPAYGSDAEMAIYQ